MGAKSMTATIRTFYDVFKVRIGLAIMLSALAGLAAAEGPALPGWKVAVLGLAVLASSGAAGAFNHLMERDLDGRMKRTARRPFVTGALRVGPAWFAGVALLLAAAVTVAGLVFNPWVALHLFLGAIVYGVVYTVWLKRTSTANIVVGGLAGSFAVLAGAAAIDPGPGPQPLVWILAGVLFLWTPPHFWSLAQALREDYANAGVPMLPAVLEPKASARVILAHTFVLVCVSLTPVWFGFGLLYLAMATLGGAVFLVASMQLVQTPDRPHAMAAFKASLVQLTCVLVATMIEGASLAP